MKRIAFVFLCLFFCLGSVFGVEPEQDLREAFDSVLEELNTKDLEGFLSRWHDEAVLYTARHLFPVDRVDAGKEVWNEIFEDFFGRTHKATMTAVDLDARVVGETGMVWGLVQSIIEPSAGDRVVDQVRLTATFVRVQGSWKILNWHMSFPPSGRPAGSAAND